jgi:NADH-quinone oxidoreductase subunit H
MAEIVTPQLVFYVAVVLTVFIGLQMGAAVMVYAERKVAAFMQQRFGPYLVGPRGLFQPVADIVKLIFKEDLRPKAADAVLFLAAPVISVAAAYVAFAPVPFGAATTFFGLLDEPMPLLVADINVAVLVVFAVASMGVYGIVLAGWSSNSNAFAPRRPAQLGADDQYELSYGVALAIVILLANSCRCARSWTSNRVIGSASSRGGTSSQCSR